MDAFDILRAARRHWRACLVLLTTAVAVLTVIGLTVPSQFTTQATMLVVRQAGPESPNPYGLTDPAQIQVSTLLVGVLQAPEFVDPLERSGELSELTVSNESGPVQERSGFLTVDVTARTEQAARQAADLVVGRARSELIDRQNQVGVPETERMTLVDVVSPTAVEASAGARLRALGIIGALELVLVTVAITTIDRVSRRRPGSTSSSRSGPAPGLPGHGTAPGSVPAYRSSADRPGPSRPFEPAAAPPFPATASPTASPRPSPVTRTGPAPSTEALMAVSRGIDSVEPTPVLNGHPQDGSALPAVSDK